MQRLRRMHCLAVLLTLVLVWVWVPVALAQQSSRQSSSPTPSRTSSEAPTSTSTPDATGGLTLEQIERLSNYFKLKIVPGSLESKNCTYLSTPQPEDNPGGTTWDCPAGYFCMTSTHREKCPPGFMCPPNTAQPFYCCGGHYCPTPAEIKICPEGKFCPLGSTEVQGCHFLARCPPGTDSVSRIGVALLFVVMMIFVAIVSNLGDIACLLWDSAYASECGGLALLLTMRHMCSSLPSRVVSII
jgi:hypothetical protein